MVRSILGVVAGLVLGCVLIALIQQISLALYPLAEGLDPDDPESWQIHVKGLPVPAFLIVLASYAVGSVGGGWITALIARRTHLTPSIVLGAIFTAFGFANILVLPHPVWFIVAALAIPIPCAWVGGRMAGKAKKKE